MADQELLKILNEGVEAWNKYRGTTIYSQVFITEMSLANADLSYRDLRGVNFSNVNLSSANLGYSNLTGAILIRTDLSVTNLDSADLTGVNLRGSNLTTTNFSNATLQETDFTNVVLYGAKFVHVDLSKAKGLDAVSHWGACHISTDTLQLSKGKIPTGFLRGCGLSDWELESAKLYAPDLSNEEINKILYKMYDLRASQAIQVSPLFISYSHADSTFVDKLEKYLNSMGVRFWRDIHDAKSGRLEKQIDQAIHQTSTVLLILSEHSIKSDWVEHEVRIARGVEKKSGRDVLCPVALDDSWKDSHWPKRVMEQVLEYNILDFSDWKDDAKFEGMFRKLIDGLELFYKE